MSRTKILVLGFSPRSELAASVRAILCDAAPPDEYQVGERTIADCGPKCSQRCGSVISRCEPDVLFLCANDAEGEELSSVLMQARAEFKSLPIIVVVTAGSPEAINSLMEKGATDFIIAPVRPAEILARLTKWKPQRAMRPVAQTLKEKLGLKSFIGESPALMEAIQRIPALAACDANVLITGETGTGKELCARAIHYLSPRSHKPFVPVNCGAIPLELVENELFGHEPGAFTSATSSSLGLLRAADGGTVLLDEIDALPGPAQVKLLRFIQERHVQPLGSSRGYAVNLRVISSCNTALDEAVRTRQFRQDLYYRLNVVPIQMPPLRQRLEDVPHLARHFLSKYASEFKKGAVELSTAAVRRLMCYDWPGNIRELENIIERALVISSGPVILAEDILLPNSLAAGELHSFRNMKAKVVADFERGYIQQLLLAHDWNISRAAEAAQKHRRAFWHLMRKHEIRAPGRASRPAAR